MCSCTQKSPDATTHFARSFVSNDTADFSFSAMGPERLETSMLLYCLLCSCSLCSCSRTRRRTSATAVNLHIQHKFVVFLKHDTWKAEVVKISSHHFCRLSRHVSAGAPMQAICCLHFHSGSSTSVRVTTISSASFKMFSICCSTICITKRQTIKYMDHCCVKESLQELLHREITDFLSFNRLQYYYDCYYDYSSHW